MPYDETIAKRLSEAVKGRKGFSQKKMFGGICLLLHGNMCSGVHKDYLILRLGEEEAEKALKHKHTKAFDITGRAMKGWVMVHKDGFKDEAALKDLLEEAIAFVKKLPKKE